MPVLTASDHMHTRMHTHTYTHTPMQPFMSSPFLSSAMRKQRFRGMEACVTSSPVSQVLSLLPFHMLISMPFPFTDTPGSVGGTLH